MPPTATGPKYLDLEDFRRLGVRPYECRLTVIRRAAARSSKTLAERQLQAPSEQVALQLSRVATSTYRLLDPRQRHDSNQRAFIGRILPNALAWAGHTSFHNGAASGTTNFSVPFQSVETSDADLIELIEIDPSPAERDDDWTHSLNADDLLRTTPLSRQAKRIRRRVQRPWVMAALAGMLVMAAVGYSSWSLNSQRIARLQQQNSAEASALAPQRSNPMAGEPSTAQPLSAQASPAQASSAQASSAQASSAPGIAGTGPTPPMAAVANAAIPNAVSESGHREPEPVAPITAAPSAAAPDSLDPNPIDPNSIDPNSIASSSFPTAAPRALPASTWEPDLLLDANNGWPSEADMLVPVQDRIDSVIAGAALPEANSPRPFSPDPFLPDPFSLDPFEMANESSVATIPEVIEPMTEEFDQPAGVSLLPANDRVVAARSQVISLLPKLAGRIDSSQVAENIEQLQTLGDKLAIGTAEHWTTNLMLVEVAWLVEDVASIRSRLEPLAGQYNTSVDLPWASSYVNAYQHVASDQTRRQLLRNGLILSERLLLNESIDQCKQVIDAARRAADLLDDEESIQYLDQFTESAEQMSRLAESTDRMMVGFAGIGEPSGDVGIAGRYLCLMLRRWDVGLLWLAETSDPRIASIARQESKLADTATADDLVALADRWLGAATRSTGRAADSMRLHALDLLQLASGDLSGLKKLKAERQIEEIKSNLPFFVNESLISTPAATPAPVAVPHDDVREPGLSGRIRVDDRDIGVQLNYSMEMLITPVVLRQISEQLNQNLDSSSLELEGEFQLKDSLSVRVTTATPHLASSQSVWVDDQLVALDPDAGTADVPLTAGKHTLRWSFQPRDQSRAFLRVRDAATGDPVDLRRPGGSGTTNIRTVLTVNMIP